MTIVCAALAALSLAADPKVTVAPGAPKAVALAADEFGKYWREVTGRPVAAESGTRVSLEVDPALDAAHDEYRILSDAKGLRIIGANGRAVLYAVYDFYERQAGCRWFWDCDRVPKRGTIGLDGLDVREKARFEYRGLRQFAHRGLTRFQAEHWGPDEWKREIDWCLKRRLNCIMPRIGMDDTWQKAYPDIVPYPDPAAPDPGDGLSGYDNRRPFWSLRYRGELRRQFTAYALDRELIIPTDFGTMTHWYARTPVEFLRRENPPFLPRASGSNYDEPSGLVWDVFRKPWLDRYWHLTEAFIGAGYGTGDYLHTIGLGERRCFADRAKNLRMKKDVLSLITAKALSHYPDAKVLLAGWDFYCKWTPDEVRSLVAELDPSNTVIWDYEAEAEPGMDCYGRAVTNDFTKWGVVGRFPYTFGIFLAYENGLDVRANYRRIEAREDSVRDDPFCRGYLLWPESSHTDVFLLRYFTANAWRPGQRADDLLPVFCVDRYGGQAPAFERLWRKVLPISQTLGWGGNCGTDLTSCEAFLRVTPEEARTLVRNVPDVLAGLAEIDFSDAAAHRDAVDLGRTALDRLLIVFHRELKRTFESCRAGGDAAQVEVLRWRFGLYRRLLDAMTKVLSLHADYSLVESLERLRSVAPVSADFEKVLLDNASCEYCRSHQVELAVGLYAPFAERLEAELLRRAVTGSCESWTVRDNYDLSQSLIKAMMNRPLGGFHPRTSRTSAACRKVFAEAARDAAAALESLAKFE